MSSRVLTRVARYALSRMRERGGTWFAYAPMCSDAPDDDLRYLQVGPRCPYRRPPARFPDTNHLGSGFSHLLLGMVDLEDGVVRAVAWNKMRCAGELT